MHIDTDFEQIKADLINELGEGHLEYLPYEPGVIRKHRKKFKWSGEDLAERVGLTQPIISDLERADVAKKVKAGEIGLDGDPERLIPMAQATWLWALAKQLGCDFREIAYLPALSSTDITPDRIRQLQERLLTIEMVPMLIHPGEKTRIGDVYYRTMLIDRAVSKKERMLNPEKYPAFQTDCLDEIPKAATAILGKAGQGKSIFLRYLTIQETLHAQNLPLFFELRLLPEGSLREAVLSRLIELGIGHERSDLDAILAKGRVALLFDAYDELDFERRETFLSELRQLHATHPNLKIVVTSRPDSGILHCDWLHPYAIMPLSRPDVEAVIRIYAEKGQADAIIQQVQNVNAVVFELLMAPIFVVLLVIRFDFSSSIPESINDFYRDLFDALIHRHNRSDSGLLKRKIESKLSPYLLEKVFRTLSYHLHKAFGEKAPHLRQVEETAATVAARLSLAVESPALIIGDIIRITNLILDEAGHCYYVHKSVREFYAAAYIAENITEEQARLFYRSMLKHWRAWTGVLLFLEHLDRLRYLKYFAIPDLKRFEPFHDIHYLGSFKKATIIRNTDKNHTHVACLDETECHQFFVRQLDRYGASGTFEDLVGVLGRNAAERVAKELEKPTDAPVPSVAIPREEFGKEWKYDRFLTVLGDHFTKHPFAEILKSWEAEVLARQASDSDFDLP